MSSCTISIRFGEINEIVYTNYKGEKEKRHLVPWRLYHGTTPHHKEPQWLLHGFDMDRKEPRTYGLAGIEIPTP